MSLGIFSFDPALLINSLTGYFETGEAENAPLDAALENIESVLQIAAAGEHFTEVSAIVSAGSESSVTPLVAAVAVSAEKPPIKPSAVRTPARLNEEVRKEIERLIKSLQISVIHNYKSTDLIDEIVSRETTSKFAERKSRADSEDKNETLRRQQKIDERQLEMLREELKKSILKNITKV